MPSLYKVFGNKIDYKFSTTITLGRNRHVRCRNHCYLHIYAQPLLKSVSPYKIAIGSYQYLAGYVPIRRKKGEKDTKTQRARSRYSDKSTSGSLRLNYYDSAFVLFVSLW